MSWSPDVYTRALHFAARAHGDQRVPGLNLPYVVHLGIVCAEVQAALRAEPGHDEDLAIACALLHDTIEDCDVSAQQIETVFGPAVRAGVQALTKDNALPKAERMADSLRRIREQPRAVWIVKLADRTANMLPPPADWPAAKCRAYQQEARVILETLGGASPTLAQRLAERIERYAVPAEA